jgi:hypothetical protein
MFKQMDLKGKAKDDTQLKTVHQNTVTVIRPYQASESGVTQFSCKLNSCPPPSYNSFSLLTFSSERCRWSCRRVDPLDNSQGVMYGIHTNEGSAGVHPATCHHVEF